MSVLKTESLNNSNLVIYDKDGKQVYTFFGQVKDNLPNGFGKKVLQNGNSFQGLFQAGVLDGEARIVIDLNIYDCMVESDILTGYARVHYHDGRQFFGQLLDGLFNGLGKLLYADGSYYIGFFNKNQRSGIGRMEFENGDVYQGEWTNDQRNGHGTFTVSSTKTVQEGIWDSDVLKQQCAVPLNIVQQVGKQIKDFPLFVEQIVDDIVETNNQQFGKRVNNLSFIRQNSRAMLIQRVDKQPVILQTSEGDNSISALYSGETIAGEIYGQGSLTYKNGASYTGTFERGLKSGKGVVKFPNKVQVEGEFFDDHLIEKLQKEVFKITKFSVTDLSVEWVYTGNVVDGEASGFGVKVFSNGTKISCQFNNGNMSGIARKESPDGQVMYGVMENNLFDQYVSIYEGNGDIYIGDFSDELKDGLAYIKWKDGFSYCGNIISSVPHGFGMLNYPDNESVYYGFFSVGKRQGLGVRITPSIVEEGLFDNNQFVEQQKVDFATNINTNFLKLGQIKCFVHETENQLNNQFGISKILVKDHPIFDKLGNPYAKFYGFVHNGQPIGFGKLIQDGETIYSEFLNGKMNGLSKVVIQNVGVQECRAVNGVFDGLSHVLLQNNDEYYGYLKNSEYDGFGQLITKEQTYVGDFMDGKFHGVGTLHFNNHDKIDYVKGYFENGNFVRGSILYIDQSCQYGYFQNFELTSSAVIDVQVEFAVINRNIKLFEVLKKVRTMQNIVQEQIKQFEADYKQ